MMLEGENNNGKASSGSGKRRKIKPKTLAKSTWAKLRNRQLGFGCFEGLKRDVLRESDGWAQMAQMPVSYTHLTLPTICSV